MKRTAGFALGLKRNGKSRDRQSKAVYVAALAATGLVSSLSRTASAATDIWTGASSTNWNSTTASPNWTGNNPPATGDSFSFTGADPSGATLTDTLASSFIVDNITYSGSLAYTMTGNAFVLGTTTAATVLTNGSSVTQIINNNITFGNATQTVALTSGAVTLGGTVSSGGTSTALTLSGGFALNVNNTFSLGTNVANVLTTANTSGESVAIGNGVTMGIGLLSGGGSTGGSITFGNSSSILNDTGGSGTSFDGALSGAGVINVLAQQYFYQTNTGATNTNFSGTLDIEGGDNRFGKGGASLGSGVLELNSTAATSAVSSGIYINTGSGANGTFPSNINVVGSGGYIRGNAGSITISGNVEGSGTFILLPALTVLSGNWTSNNAFSSAFAGTVQIGATAGHPSTPQVAVNTASSTSSSATYNIVNSTTANSTLAANISGGGNLNLGALTDTNANSTYTGIVTNLLNNTSTLKVGALGTTTSFAGLIQNGAGMLAIDKVGTGIWTLSNAANSYTGTTTVDNGTLVVSGSYTGTGAYTVNNGGALNVSGSLTNASVTVGVNGGGTLAGAGGSIAGAVTVAGGASASSQGSVNLSGDATYSTLTLSGGLTVGGSSANTPSVLAFDITSGNKSDTLAIGGANGFVVNAGGTFINPVPTSVVNGETFTLATYSDTSAPAGVTFSNGMLMQTSGFLTETLSVTASAITLGVSTTPFPATAYFTGTYGSNWTDSSGANANFTTDAAGTTNTGQIPGSTTDVFLVANTDSVHTIGLGNANFEIKGLTFTGTGTPDTTATTLNNGTGGGSTLQVDADGITVQSGSGGGTIAVSSLVLGTSQTWTNNSTSTLDVTSAVSGASSALTMTGSGVFILGSANSYGGGTTVSGPTVQLGNAAALGSTSAALAISSGTLDLNGTSAAVGTLSGGGAITNSSATGTATLTVNSGGTFSGNIQNGSSNPTAVTLSGGTLIASGSNTYGGATSLNGGTLQLVATAGNTTAGVSSAMSSASALSLASGTTLQLRGDGNITFATAGISVPATTSTQTFDVGHISSGSANTLTLSGAMAVNDAGVTTFNVTDSTGSGDTLGLGTLTVQNGTLALNPTTANLSIAGIVGTSTSGNNLITTNGAGNVTFGNFTASAGKSLNLTVGTVGGTTGTVTLSGTDSFTGANLSSTLLLNSGTLILNNTAALGANLERFYIAGGSLDATVANVTSPTAATQIWSGDFTFIGTNSLNLGGGALTLSGSTRQVTVLANTLTVGGTIGDGGSGFGITKLGPGTLVLGGANTFTGATTINGGVLSTGTTGTLANGGANSSIGKSTNAAANLVLNGGALQYASTSATAASTDRLFTLGANGGTLDASGTSSITFAGNGTGAANAIAYSGSGARTLTLTGSNTGSNTLAPILADGTGGSTSLTKSGAGTWVLTDVNTFTGGTTINSGKLVANAARSFGPMLMSSTGSGSVTVASGATLAGNGGTGDVVVNGTITAGGGATSSDTIGTLTTGAQTWNSGGTYLAKVSADGTMNDLLIMSGLTVAATGGSPFNINLASEGTTALTSGQQLVIGQITGAAQGDFNTSDLSLTLFNVTLPTGDTAELLDMTSGGNDDLVVEAAPEPTSLLLFGAVVSPALLARRRRPR